MRPFQFASPTTMAEAFSVLAGAGGEVRALAGGTDLIAQMKEGRKRPVLVMDIKRIPEMMRLEYDQAAGLQIGAAVPCADIAANAAVRQRYPAIAESASLVGSVQIQNRGSIGGNVCNAAPSADTVPALIVYGARAVIVGPGDRRREMLLEEFFRGPGLTVLQPDELLLEVVVPPPPERSSAHYLRFIPREEMDIAVAGVASMVVLGPTGATVRQARIALAAVAPTPVRAREAEAALEGKSLNDDLVRETGERTVAAARPITDVRGSVEYRKELVKVLTRRTLQMCRQSLGL